MSAGPLVSVVLPAWNAERTLAETLESVRAQTYRNLEVVIIDDGSTDGTAKVAERYCATDPRARLVRKENGGVASARNRGIEESSGEWIAPVDADDLWHPTKIEKQVAAALSAPEPPGFVYCWYQSIDDLGRVLGSGPQWQFAGRAFRQLAYYNPVQNGSALLISREAALAAGGYDASLRERGAEGCEDVMIQLRIARDYPVAVVPEFLVGYRKHAGGMSRNTHQIIRSWRLVYEQLGAAEYGIPRRVFRWNEAFFDLALAEESAGRGDYARALGLLFRAIRLDPVRWGSYLLYRTARTAVRLTRGRRQRGKGVHFSELDPRSYVQGDADELVGLARLLRRIDQSRLRRLRDMPPA